MRLKLHGMIVSGVTEAAVLNVALSSRTGLPLQADEPSAQTDGFSPYVAKDGGISLPLDYREKFMHLGTYAVATKPGQPVGEMHNVYASSEDVMAYRKNGKFPDGATLVKDVLTVSPEKLTTGETSSSKNVKIWFVMVKDAKGRFPRNDLWGDGWGWALFEAKDPKKNIATDYATDCRACHVPARKDDWVYIRGYSAFMKTTTE